MNFSFYLYVDPEFNWRQLDAIHLMINHRHYSIRTIKSFSTSIILLIGFFVRIVDPYYNETPTFDENIVKSYPYPFGEMAREMIYASGMENFKI